MFRIFTMICLFSLLVGNAAAQTQVLPGDLANLPEAIRTLPWRTVDLSKVEPLEYNRALLIMNHVLDELSPIRASEADLMSTYIETQNLGVDLAVNAAPPPTPALYYTDGVKIAVAILRGPLAGSSYATDLATVSASTLGAYRQMYDRTCQRRWAEVLEATQQLRYMSAYLDKKGKTRDYQSWAKVESENRQLKYDLEVAKRKEANQAAMAQQAAAQQKSNAQIAQMARENQQLENALAVAQAQQVSAEVPTGSTATVVPAAAYDGAWYVPTYYGTDATWSRDNVYVTPIRDNTASRIAGWHGAGAAGFRR